MLMILPAARASACAVCSGDFPEQIRNAYNYSTAWLSVIPLIFMGAVIYYVYRTVKNAEK